MTLPDAGLAGPDGSLAAGVLAALLLGLRHATDPDHIAAVSTLVLGERRDVARRAGRLGLIWGAGHALTLFAFGLPVVLLRRALPGAAVRAAEVAVGAVIVTLAVRLLLRWRRGYLHMHPHAHGDVVHSHPHLHDHPPGEPHPHGHDHTHAHAEALGRTPLEAFGIGLVHGVGGSAGAGVLLVAAAPGPGAVVVALLALAAGTALSMALLSAAVGRAFGAGRLGARLDPLVPVLGVVSGGFGLWYAAAALWPA